ncbi:MAG: HK97-gp10 family putative phage morphogenesis protein [Nitrososphaeraceae archaeon]
MTKIKRDDFKVSRNTSRKLINRAARQVVRDAKNNAPVKTGNLRNKIGIKYANSNSAVVTSNANYAVFVEKGTRKMLPREYMNNAMKDTRPNYRNKLKFKSN